MPFRSLLKASPWHVLAILLLPSLVMVYFLRETTFVLSGSSTEPNVIAAGEIVCMLYALCTAALIAPPMPAVDLRRRRARMLALWRFLLGGAGVLFLAWFTSFQVNQIFVGAPGVKADFPESELFMHNAMLVYGIAGIAVTLLGKLRGIPLSLVVWVAGMSPLVFNDDQAYFFLWPFDALQEKGPWFSLPHIATSITVIIIASAVQYFNAGIGRFALAAEKSDF